MGGKKKGIWHSPYEASERIREGKRKKKKNLIVPCGIAQAWVVDVDKRFYFGFLSEVLASLHAAESWRGKGRHVEVRDPGREAGGF